MPGQDHDDRHHMAAAVAGDASTIITWTVATFQPAPLPPHAAVGIASHAIVLNAALLEMLTVWPNGTTLVINYRTGSYAQVLTYPPSVLTEIGKLTPLQMQDAVRFGWIDPGCISARHVDFDSQPVWIDNPVREWTHPYDPPSEIASFLAGSVRAVLGRDPGDGYTLHMFNIHVEREKARLDHPADEILEGP